MANVCAWCEAKLEPLPAGSLSPSQTIDAADSLCRACARELAAQMGTSLREFLDDLKTPTIVFDSETRLVKANHVACKLLGKKEVDVKGQLGGEVFECAYSKLPEGCGRTIHCSGCAIRRSVEDTFRTGTTHRRVPATLNHDGDGTIQLIHYLISTELVGGVVLLKLETTD
ncbi:MAG: hypothetical protein K1Y02_26305 [Candidatus Hydrogenedentes bacterium]|nr:hypothetical protein [Candidatus Hydrogenedentota bacterium]